MLQRKGGGGGVKVVKVEEEGEIVKSALEDDVEGD